MSLGSGKNFKSPQEEDIKTARQLCYPRSVIERLKKEPDPVKRQRILTSARNGNYKWVIWNDGSRSIFIKCPMSICDDLDILTNKSNYFEIASQNQKRKKSKLIFIPYADS